MGGPVKRVKGLSTQVHYQQLLWLQLHRLIAETWQVGSLGSVYIWFNGELVGVVKNSTVNFIHSDHLGRAEFIKKSI